MRVRVDPAMCQANGECHRICPDVFQLDEWGYAFVEGDGPVAPELQAAAEEAVAACPEGAIVAEASSPKGAEGSQG